MKCEADFWGKEEVMRKRIILEPELEALAGHLDAFGRQVLAAKLRRWARELVVTARMLRVHSGPGRRRLAQVDPDTLRLN